jgi:hypothetical protein
MGGAVQENLRIVVHCPVHGDQLVGFGPTTLLFCPRFPCKERVELVSLDEHEGEKKTSDHSPEATKPLASHGRM